MQVQIGYMCYACWSDLNGVTCSKETIDELGLKEKQLGSHDVLIERIAKHENMIISEVRAKALNNQDCH